MRNANEQDIENIRNGKPPEFNVMYTAIFGYKYHRKENVNVDPYLPEDCYLFESSSGNLLLAIYSENLQATPKKQGTPAKPKKPHIKGTKPFIYNPDNIKVGTKVKCRDGSVQVIKELWSTAGCGRPDSICFVGYSTAEFYGNVWLRDGRAHNNNQRGGRDIIYVYPEEKVEQDAFEKWWNDNNLSFGYLDKQIMHVAFSAGKESK